MKKKDAQVFSPEAPSARIAEMTKVVENIAELSHKLIPALRGEKAIKNFALIGAAGYIAPRHIEAIRSTGNRLIAAVDPHDSVGILDRYFPETRFFTEFERFDRYVEKLRRGAENNRLDYVSICSPNYLHDAHIRFALRVGAHALCEKPLVLKPWNLDALEELEQETGKRVNVVLQLRLHQKLLRLRDKILAAPKNTMHDVELTYITARGPWYLYSWKGQEERSGGLVTNIGIHLFDMLLWLFGECEHAELHLNQPTRGAGYLLLERAKVRWFLSVDRSDLPSQVLRDSQSSYRSMIVDGEQIEFSDGFTDLHTRIYEQALMGDGFGITHARPSIELVHLLRSQQTEMKASSAHALLKAPRHHLKTKDKKGHEKLLYS